MDADQSWPRRVLTLLAVFLWEARGDLLVVAGAVLLAVALWTIDWRLAVAPVGLAMIGLGARL